MLIGSRVGYARSDACGEPSAGLYFDTSETLSLKQELTRAHLCTRKVAGHMSIQVGQQAPDFTLKTSKMKDFTLSEQKGKKNVVVLFVPLAFTGG